MRDACLACALALTRTASTGSQPAVPPPVSCRARVWRRLQLLAARTGLARRAVARLGLCGRVGWGGPLLAAGGATCARRTTCSILRDVCQRCMSREYSRGVHQPCPQAAPDMQHTHPSPLGLWERLLRWWMHRPAPRLCAEVEGLRLRGQGPLHVHGGWLRRHAMPVLGCMRRSWSVCMSCVHVVCASHVCTRLRCVAPDGLGLEGLGCCDGLFLKLLRGLGLGRTRTRTGGQWRGLWGMQCTHWQLMNACPTVCCQRTCGLVVHWGASCDG